MSCNRVCVLSIIVEDREQAPTINALLGEFGNYILGRMGIPYSEKNVSIITVVLDAPMEELNKLNGKIGQLNGVSSKLLLSKNNI